MGPPHDAIRARLAATTLFQGVAREHLDPLVEAATLRRWARGTAVWREGSSPDAMVAIFEGSLDVARRGPRGLRILRTLYPPAVVGLSCVAGAPHTADLVAGVGLRGAVLPGSAVRALFRRAPDVALRALAQLGALVGRLSAELEARGEDDLDTRLAAWLEARFRHGPVIVSTHDEVAAHVGATRPRVSQALKRCERAGWIRCERGRIRQVGTEPATDPTPPG